jgi:hypothetical protein
MKIYLVIHAAIDGEFVRADISVGNDPSLLGKQQVIRFYPKHSNNSLDVFYRCEPDSAEEKDWLIKNNFIQVVK